MYKNNLTISSSKQAVMSRLQKIATEMMATYKDARP
jgi:hypothetical protein